MKITGHLATLIIVLGFLMAWMIKDLSLTDAISGPLQGLGAFADKTTDVWTQKLAEKNREIEHSRQPSYIRPGNR